MANKVVFSVQEPTYGFVTADPGKSQGFDPITSAKNLYSSMYGGNLAGRYANLTGPALYDDRPFASQLRPEEFKNAQAYENLMGWYYAATNPLVQQNKAASDLLKFRYQDQLAGIERPYSTQVAPFKYTFDKTAYDRANNPFGTLMDQYSVQDLALADKLIAESSAGSLDNRLKSTGKLQQAALEKTAGRQQNLAEQAFRDSMKELNSQSIYGAPMEFQTPAGVTKINEPNKYNYLQGASAFANKDPNLYAQPLLQAYTEGLNPNLENYKGLKWQVNMRNPNNESWTGGGEFLADEAFRYYKNKSQAGQAGTDWASVAGTPYTKQGTFNNQQSFFTPYDYAVPGIYDPVQKTTLRSNLDPNFWANQGNLQNINNQWGFVTQTNPFATPDSMGSLGMDTITGTLRTGKGPSFLESLGMALPSIGLGLIPGLGAISGVSGLLSGAPSFATLASLIQGIGSLDTALNSAPNRNKNQETLFLPGLMPSWYTA